MLSERKRSSPVQLLAGIASDPQLVEKRRFADRILPSVTNGLSSRWKVALEQFLPGPDELPDLSVLTAAVRADAPALFVSWVEDVRTVRLPPLPQTQVWYQFAQGAQWLEETEQSLTAAGGATPPEAGLDLLLVCNGLAAIPPRERRLFNAARERLLDLRVRIIFIEQIDSYEDLHGDFPDVFSLVRLECWEHQGQRRDAACLGHVGSAEVAPEAAVLRGEILRIDGNQAICWLEIAPGARVKTQLALDLLQHLDPEEGMEFSWQPSGTNLSVQQFTEVSLPPVSEQSRKEFEKLSRQFNQDLNSRQLWTNDEGQE